MNSSSDSSFAVHVHILSEKKKNILEIEKKKCLYITWKIRNSRNTRDIFLAHQVEVVYIFVAVVEHNFELDVSIVIVCESHAGQSPWRGSSDLLCYYYYYYLKKIFFAVVNFKFTSSSPYSNQKWANSFLKMEVIADIALEIREMSTFSAFRMKVDLDILRWLYPHPPTPSTLPSLYIFSYLIFQFPVDLAAQSMAVNLAGAIKDG